jgi:lysophospholipase L1-like esterase
MRRGLAARIGVGVFLTIVASACAPQATRPITQAASKAQVVYAAIGASETYGVGADDRYRQSWPQVFYNDALPPSAVLYNFGIPGATTAQALRDEVPAALADHPSVVTVWLNVNDLIQGVPASTYAQQLQQLIHALRQNGRGRVLVANTPDISQLPAYRACLPNAPAGGPACPIPPTFVPSPAAVATAVDGYNAAIARVAEQEGATLVDLHLSGALIDQHPDWFSSDGFHPNGQGYAVIAALFEAAYRQKGQPASTS